MNENEGVKEGSASEEIAVSRRAKWQRPKLRRLAAGEAEDNAGNTFDAIGIS
jgi:hypothetical protein